MESDHKEEETSEKMDSDRKEEETSEKMDSDNKEGRATRYDACFLRL